jgi:hypothetical protein
MAAFKLHLPSGKQRNVGWVGDDIQTAFGKKNFLLKEKM